MQIQESMCYNWIESMHPELKSFNEAIYKKTWTNEIKLKKSMHMTQMWWEGIYLFVNKKNCSLMAVLTLTIFQSNPLKKKKKKGFRGNLGNDRTNVTKALRNTSLFLTIVFYTLFLLTGMWFIKNGTVMRKLSMHMVLILSFGFLLSVITNHSPCNKRRYE